MEIPRPAGRRSFGMQQEEAAADYLRSQGLTLIQRNFQCRTGEIDLIMREDEVLVFVEVRFRRSTTHGSAAESVDIRKQKKLLRSAQYYLQVHGLSDKVCSRFDVLAMSLPQSPGSSACVEWIRNAFGGN